VQILQWPPNSPDLSPIENLWALMKNDIEAKKPNNTQELEVYIQEFVSKVDAKTRANFINSIYSRFGKCIEKKGRAFPETLTVLWSSFLAFF